VRSNETVTLQCDLNYSKHTLDGENYVPCIFEVRGSGEAIQVLLDFLNIPPNTKANTKFGTMLVRPRENSIEVLIFKDALDRGYAFGEIITLIEHILIGAAHCVRIYSKKNR